MIENIMGTLLIGPFLRGGKFGKLWSGWPRLTGSWERWALAGCYGSGVTGVSCSCKDMEGRLRPGMRASAHCTAPTCDPQLLIRVRVDVQVYDWLGLPWVITNHKFVLGNFVRVDAINTRIVFLYPCLHVLWLSNQPLPPYTTQYTWDLLLWPKDERPRWLDDIYNVVIWFGETFISLGECVINCKCYLIQRILSPGKVKVRSVLKLWSIFTLISDLENAVI